jgi:hypothetical protein
VPLATCCGHDVGFLSGVTDASRWQPLAAGWLWYAPPLTALVLWVKTKGGDPEGLVTAQLEPDPPGIPNYPTREE